MKSLSTVKMPVRFKSVI